MAGTVVYICIQTFVLLPRTTWSPPSDANLESGSDPSKDVASGPRLLRGSIKLEDFFTSSDFFFICVPLLSALTSVT